MFVSTVCRASNSVATAAAAATKSSPMLSAALNHKSCYSPAELNNAIQANLEFGAFLGEYRQPKIADGQEAAANAYALFYDNNADNNDSAYDNHHRQHVSFAVGAAPNVQSYYRMVPNPISGEMVQTPLATIDDYVLTSGTEIQTAAKLPTCAAQLKSAQTLFNAMASAVCRATKLPTRGLEPVASLSISAAPFSTSAALAAPDAAAAARLSANNSDFIAVDEFVADSFRAQPSTSSSSSSSASSAMQQISALFGSKPIVTPLRSATPTTTSVDDSTTVCATTVRDENAPITTRYEFAPLELRTDSTESCTSIAKQIFFNAPDADLAHIANGHV